MKKLLILSGLLFFSCVSPHRNAEGMNSGIIYGDDHVYSLTACEDWVMDNTSAVNQGLFCVFYPKDRTWANSPVVAYSKAVSKNDSLETIKDMVSNTIREFRQNGSPDSRVRYMKNIETRHGKVADIYFFTGDQWGNYEAVAYFDEGKCIPFIVLSSRAYEVFEKSLPNFESIVKSYMFFGSDITICLNGKPMKRQQN